MKRSKARTTRISTRLFLVMVVPLSGLVFFAGVISVGRWSDERSYATQQRGVEFLNAIGNLVHELQKERGRSAGYLSSKGAQFAQELPEQQRATDGLLEAYRNRRQNLPPELLRGALGTTLAELESALDELAG